MIGRIFTWTVWGLAAAAVVFAAPTARSQADISLPLGPDEVIIPTRNCSLVVNAPPGSDVDALRTTYAKMTWDGPCRYGLAHGIGTFGEPDTLASLRGYGVQIQNEAVFGRLLPGSRTVNANGDVETMASANGRSASLKNLDDSNTPRWGPDNLRGGSQMVVYANDDYTSVSTWTATCRYYDQDKMSAEEKRANKGCRENATFTIYYIWRSTKSDTTGVHRYCPDPRTTVGCEALWREITAPLVPQVKAIQAEAATNAAAVRSRVAQLMQSYDRRLAEAEAARRQEAMERAAEAQASAEKEEAEFQASLKTKSAGQLFALADELRANGDIDRGRETLRALVSRFPDHPLALNAAEQLSQMGSSSSRPSGSMASLPPVPAPGAGNPPSSTAPARGATAVCANPLAEEERIGGLAQASAQRFPGEVVRPAESLLWAIVEIQKLYRACPSHPSSAAKLRDYAELYTQTMRACAAHSSTTTCQPRLH